MRTVVVASSLLELLVRATAFPQVRVDTALTVEQWRDDLRYMAEKLPAAHADAFHSVSRDQFELAVRALDARIPFLSAPEILVGFARIGALIGDGHSGVPLWPRPDLGFRVLPVRFSAFREGLAITAIDSAEARAAGAELLAIDGMPASEALARVKTIIAADNEWSTLNLASLQLSNVDVLHALGVVTSRLQVRLTIREPSGLTRTISLQPRPASTDGIALLYDWTQPAGLASARARSSNPPPLWLQHLDKPYWFVAIKERGAVYAQVNDNQDAEGESLAGFYHRLFATADTLRAQRIIIDVRRNDGGMNDVNLPLMHEIVARPNLNRPGGIVVLIGRQTFSAAQHLTSLLASNTAAIFVGEPTGGSPNHYGSGGSFRLPHSHLRIRYAVYEEPDAGQFDRRTTLAPDVYVPMSVADYRDNRDPVLEAALRWAPAASLDERLVAIAQRDGVDAMFDAWRGFRADERNMFVETAPALRTVAARLLSAKRVDDAIRVYEASVDAGGGSFAYSGLARAALARGDTARAVSLLRRAVLLNPINQSATRLLESLGATWDPALRLPPGHQWP